MGRKVVIVGGVAGGMSCAARIRRLDESIKIVVFEKGDDVSFANCGMPYYIGGMIADRENMLVQTPGGLNDRYDIDVHVRHEVMGINREQKRVTVKNLATGETFDEAYDRLVLSPGAAPFRPPIPGAEADHVFVLNDLKDMDRIVRAAAGARKAIVVGGGFIGLELVENLRARGLEVSLIEMLDQVMPPLDKEMTKPLLQELRLNGVDLYLEDTVETIEGNRVQLRSGKALESDFICLSVGVRPTSCLARDAGLALGPRGHIRVDERMRTSDPDIYAVGDAVEIRDWVTGDPVAVPLAGPANRQGRIAADNICGRSSAYRGTQGTSIVKVFNMAAAMTGLSEKRLKALGRDFRRLYLHPTQHPKYYPNAQMLGLKLLFSPDGDIYGAQVVGAEGAKTLIDTIAAAMRGSQKVWDLEHLELAYSPQWGGAKDPINMAGFVATNLLQGDVEAFEADDMPDDIFLLDVRDEDEIEAGMLPGATVIPLGRLRRRVDELPRNREIGVYCAVGLRGYLAYRFLKQHGFSVRNLNGGYRTWSWFQQGMEQPPAVRNAPAQAGEARTALGKEDTTDAVKLDVCGMQCPGPIGKVKEAAGRLAPGQVLEVISSDPGFASDIPAWCRATGNTLLEVKPEGGNYVAKICVGAKVSSAGADRDTRKGEGMTLIQFSGDLDKALATFIIANGAASMGKKATIFFTFWGLNVLRRENASPVTKTFIERMFGFMMPKGPNRLKLSKMHMAGMGSALIKGVMKSKNVMSLPELIHTARNAGVRFVACAMSMDLMGIKQEELIDGVEIAGVGTYLGATGEANVNLFV
ncbi:MAG: DsrE/DsrF/DrsH-like family protein [Planctomycetota bacterium]